SGTSVVVTGLTAGVTYYYRVIATNAFCLTTPSDTQSVLTVASTPGIGHGPTSISHSLTLGDSLSSDNLGVTNIGLGTLSYTVTDDAGWLSVSPGSGSLSAGSAQQHTVSYNQAGLQPGTSNATITIADASASNTPQTVSVTLTLNAIPDPTAQSATADGNELIDLAWTKNASYDVMIVYHQGSAPGTPIQGTAHAVGDSIPGGGTVLYKGGGAALEHIVQPGASHNYAFYSINNNFYSPGVSDSVSVLAYGVNELVDQAAYTNGVDLDGLAGGNGWTNAWSDSSGDFTIASDSPATQTNYPANAANRILVNPPGGAERVAFRYFEPHTSGRLYIGYILNFQYSGSGKYEGISFYDGATEEMFFGEVGGADLKLGVGGATSAYTLNTTTDYLIIGYYDFDANEARVNAYAIGFQAVPETEPGSWQATYSDASITSIDGIRLVSGAGSGTPGNTYFDEIRIATNWVGLLNLVAAPEIAVLGTNLALITDGDVTPDLVDGTDFGDVNAGSGSLSHTFTITNAGNSVLTLSGVTTSSTMGAAADFTVVSWPGTVSAGAASNLVIAFDPSALGLRTAVVAIASDDADEASYEFTIQGTGTGSFQTLAFQGFEGLAADSWNYTFVSNGASVYVDGDTNAAGEHALTLGGSDSLNADPYIEFDGIDISGLLSVTLEVAYAAAGADTGDDLYLDISYDGGANWDGPGSVKLYDGVSNADLDFGATDANAVTSNPWKVTLVSTAEVVAIRIRYDEAAADNSFDRYFTDDILLTGAGSKPSVSFGNSFYATTETNGTLTVPVSISAAADATVRVSVVGSATAGGGNDFTINATNILFSSAGSTTSNLVFTLNDDLLEEGLENLRLELVDITGALPGEPSVASVLIQDDDTLSIMTANLVSGTNLVGGVTSYDETGLRLIQRLRPDVLAIQEWVITNASYRAFVDAVLGTNYYYYVEPESDSFPIPNGVISRYPFVATNEWADSYVGARDHVHVEIDLPGPRNLQLVSVHFKAGDADFAIRENEARELTNYIATAGFPTNDYLVIAGDLNLSNRSETALTVLTSQWVTDASQPTDSEGDTDTNLGKNAPYDFVLPNDVLETDHLALPFAGVTFPDGMVFDANQWGDHPLPARVGDTYQLNRTHHPVMKLFSLSTSAIPPIVSTTVATVTNDTTATAGGVVTSDGGATVTNRGVVWSTTANPVVGDPASTNGTGVGSFASTLTGLTPGQTYYYRAYAQNSAGVGYGAEYELTAQCFASVVTGLYANPTNETDFTANWDAFSGASGYLLQVSTNFAGSGVGGTNSFTAIGGGTASSYLTRNWVEGGVNWSATKSRTDQSLDGSDAVALRDEADAYLISTNIPDGLGTLTFEHQQVFSGSGGELQVIVNGSLEATIPYNTSIQTATVSGINVSGLVTLMI
ncbi:MAG: choice-of-anchor D domain-containing protein, partial [Kiritimatiellae bacterium]|nr:choice-of-anchor D domain-containing protein [Kiritimatiellia bacterium]